MLSHVEQEKLVMSAALSISKHLSDAGLPDGRDIMHFSPLLKDQRSCLPSVFSVSK